MRPLTPWVLVAAMSVAAPSLAQAQDGDVSADTVVDNPLFSEVEAALSQGRKTVAADLLLEIIEDPEQTTSHAEAHARMGNVLMELDLPYSALIALEGALDLDPVAVSASAKDAIILADKVGDTALLEDVFAKNVGLAVDAATRSRMAYLAAREAHRTANYGTAQAILMMVRDSDPYFPEAMALYGVITTLQGRPTDALKHFQTALRAGEEHEKGDRFRNVVTLNLARAYYTAENFPRAIEHYAMVDRSSRQWPEAEFERAWAHFRLQDMNGAIGLLHDHAGPFFVESYFPEAHLLRVHSLFMMCKFPEANLAIEAFDTRYRPQLKELTRVALLSPETIFAEMRSHEESGNSDLPPMVTWFFEEEDRFIDSLTAIRTAEDEMGRLRNISANPFSLAAMRWVRDRHEALVTQEGLRIRGRVALMADELEQMLNDAEISKLDIMQLETRLYEVASMTGEMPEAQRTVERRLKTRRGHRNWPYEGEYWADEAGYYRVSARPDCPNSLRIGE
jgi:tetratricopeptide (TPR) repeat protein